ncbi:MAG: serine hydrolase [bacterium]|nr:serine hydrolase [bacterium]
MLRPCLLCLMLTAAAFSADLRTYEGGWSGTIASPSPFRFNVSLSLSNDTATLLSLSNGTTQWLAELKPQNGCDHADFGGVTFDGLRDSLGMRGFIQSGVHQYHIAFTRSDASAFTGYWSPFMLPEMDNRVLLSIENCTADSYEAYLILGDSRAPRLMCGNFSANGDTLLFGDFRTGLQFAALLRADEIVLMPQLAGRLVAQIPLRRATESWAPRAEPSKSSDADEWTQISASSAGFDERALSRLADSVAAGIVTATHSVLIARHGKLAYEQYFAGYDAVTPHDLRSAQKTFTGAAIGSAIERGLLKSLDTPIYDYLPAALLDTRATDERKARITVGHLLTMSSGLDAVDFGADHESAASEDAYQQTPDWPRTILSAPLINEPGAVANYGSANACLAGAILASVSPLPPQLFLDETLFLPLGITDYILQTDFSGQTYGAGGMFMRPRDMLKIGQLYLNGGEWQGRRVLPSAWVADSWRRHTTLANTEQHNGYGYFWWERQYDWSGKSFIAHEARGAGGQYISVIPELDLVIVVTSGNFRNGRFWQPEAIIEQYILPAVVRH